MDTMLNTLACITVTFFPNFPILEKQLELLPKESLKVIVDNSADEEIAGKLSELAATDSSIALYFNKENIGLGAAINRGFREISQSHPGIDYLLLLDQDTEAPAESVACLLNTFRQLEKSGFRVGTVGPNLYDPATGLYHGFHQPTRFFWRRVFQAPGSGALIPCQNINGSGTLTTTKIFNSLHGLEESFFIDHIDTEWAFRLISQGYQIYGVANAVFTHRMGEVSDRIWIGKWVIWPRRSPTRVRFLFRNTFALIKRPYVPFVWKFWAVIKTCMTFGVCLTHSNRGEYLKKIFRLTDS